MNHLQQSTNERTSLLAFSTRFSFWTLIISLMAIVATAMGAKNLYFRGDYNIFFDGSNAQLQAFDEIQTTFAKTDNIALVLAPKSGDVFDQRTLTQIQEMTEQAWQVPYSSRVDSLANYQHTEAVDDDLLVEDLLYQSYPLTAERIAKVRAVAMSEPLLVNALVSEKGDVAVINITMQMPGVDETAEVNEVVAYVEQMLSHYRAEYPDVTIYKAGIIAMNHSFAMAAQKRQCDVSANNAFGDFAFSHPHAAFVSQCFGDVSGDYWRYCCDVGHRRLGWNVFACGLSKCADTDHDIGRGRLCSCHCQHAPFYAPRHAEITSDSPQRDAQFCAYHHYFSDHRDRLLDDEHV